MVKLLVAAVLILGLSGCAVFMQPDAAVVWQQVEVVGIGTVAGNPWAGYAKYHMIVAKPYDKENLPYVESSVDVGGSITEKCKVGKAWDKTPVTRDP